MSTKSAQVMLDSLNELIDKRVEEITSEMELCTEHPEKIEAYCNRIKALHEAKSTFIAEY